MNANSALEERLAIRESFARWLAIVLVFIATGMLLLIIPSEIDYNNPSQMLYIGGLSGTVFGWVTSACQFFFFIQATEQRGKEQSKTPVNIESVDISTGGKS